MVGFKPKIEETAPNSIAPSEIQEFKIKEEISLIALEEYEEDFEEKPEKFP